MKHSIRNLLLLSALLSQPLVYADLSDANKYLKEKDYNSAFVEFKKIVNEPSSDELGGNEHERNQAKMNLAYLYYKGFGVTQDYSESLKLLKSLISTGSPDVFYALGVHYYSGYGVAKDVDLARKLWTKSAELGSVPAKKILEKTKVIDEGEWLKAR
jgi:TPR repeat protein